MFKSHSLYSCMKFITWFPNVSLEEESEIYDLRNAYIKQWRNTEEYNYYKQWTSVVSSIYFRGKKKVPYKQVSVPLLIFLQDKGEKLFKVLECMRETAGNKNFTCFLYGVITPISSGLSFRPWKRSSNRRST